MAPALGEKLEGYIWDVNPLIVEGIEVSLTAKTKLKRKNHRNITAADLRVGWEVKIDGEVEGERFVAKKINVETDRNEKVKTEGYVDAIRDEYIEVEGRRLRWNQTLARTNIRSGMHIKSEGVLLDDGTIDTRKVKDVEPWRRDKGELEYLALASAELEKLKENLAFYDDRLFQEYVARVGHGLVPEWVDDDIDFNFSIVDDSSLNAFALPDGTIVVHTGLLATLENEAQLATVLGHEIAHVTHKHGYRGYKRARKMQWLALGAAIAGAAIDANRSQWDGPSGTRTLVELGAALSLTAAVNGHGRNLEDDADRIGLNYVLDAGYDPFEAPEVWRIFNKHSGDRNEAANWFFGNHSTHRARISNLTREINRYYRGHLDDAELTRNQDEYDRMVVRLRRHNAIQDYHLKEYRNAYTAFQKILENDPNDAEAHLYVGKILWDTEGRDMAEDVLFRYRRAAELDPSYADPYREMGFVYYSLGDRTRCIESLEKYLHMAPHAADAQEIRGYLRDLR